MNEINTSNPQEFQKLIKTLKNNANWQDKLESLLTVEKAHRPKKQTVDNNQKFRKHPERIDSEISLISMNNEYSDKSVALIFKKSLGISESQSDENLFNEAISYYKCSDKKDFHSLPIIEMLNDQTILSPKKRVKTKHNAKIKSARKHQEEMHTTRGTVDKIHFDQKLESLLNNILSSSERIRITMDIGISPPDGDEEWERRYARAKEFYSRFSRNYLYRLGRQVADLENYYIKSAGRTSNRTTENIQQHLLAVHNIILNALQAYFNHMPTSLSYVAIDKLMNIFEHMSKCCTIMNKFFTRQEDNACKCDYLVEEVSVTSKEMVDKLAKILFEMPQLYCLTLPTAKSMRKGYKWEVKVQRKKKPVKKMNLDTRLSMYSIASTVRIKNPALKKTVEDLSKDRFSHVQSRYKTAGFKHRLPVDKPVIVKPTRSRFFEKQSSCLLRNTPLLTPNKDDDIETLVEMEYKREKEYRSQKASENLSPEKAGASKQVEAMTPLIQGLCQHVCTQDGKNVTQDKLENLLKSLLGMALDGKINNTNTEATLNKNGIMIKHGDPNEKHDFSERSENEVHPSPNVQDRSNASDKVHMHSDKSEKDLSSYIDFIKTIRQELEINNTNDKRKKIKSCTSLMETIESVPDCEDNNRLSDSHILETPHKVTFRDNSKANTKKEDKCKVGKKKRRQLISVSGEKNAQLICIRDEDSIIESSEEKKSHQDKSKDPTPTNNNLVENQEPPKHKNSRGIIKISRLPKKLLKPLDLLPNMIMYNVIKYKISYKKFSRQNPMYRKSPTIQPWEIVDSISDNLLNELILGIATEIEENNVLKKLYESEFY